MPCYCVRTVFLKFFKSLVLSFQYFSFIFECDTFLFRGTKELELLIDTLY